ncbi:MAG: glycoside hydrolase family 3 N-terminal domain-containing protein [Ignavibacteria bacterium]
MNYKNKYNCINKYKLLILSILIILLLPCQNIAQIYSDSTDEIEVRVNDLISRMTLDEKIGQMIQMHYPDLSSLSEIKTYFLGSLLSAADAGPAGRTPQAWADLYDTLQSYALQTRLKIPLIYSLDAVHGFGAMYGATIFPHNIGLGCTRNTELVKQAAQVTASEMAATGIDWTLGPTVAVARNEKWGRTYESFGEDPDLVKEMSAAAVAGFQGDTLSEKVNILACAKHFIGDGGTANGINGGNTALDEQTLRAIHLAGYISAVEQKVGSIMVTQSQWNGIHVHGNPYLLDTLLKQELGFKGLVISDWNSFLFAGNPSNPTGYPLLYGAAIKNSINAGVDMAMMSNFSGFNHRTYIDTLKSLINKGMVSIERIDDAVKRILTQKFRLGLFEHPYSDRSLLSQIGSPEHRQIARECVRQSLVLLKKKDGVLPISKSINRIHLSGKHADNIGYQCGGWTISWQGSSGDIIPGTTIKEAIQLMAPGAAITSSEDGYGAEGADIAIAVIGETPYAEVSGDGKTTLNSSDIQTVRNLKSCGIPVVVILISGRPLILDPILHDCDVLIAAWLPGTEGEGITDVLFGDYQPVGLLSQTWPKSAAQIPINIGDPVYDPLFHYGYGITSLDDSPFGSSPEVYSASIVTIHSMEISFNKKMMVPSDASGFSITANGNSQINISSVSLKSSDSTIFIITFEDSVLKTNTYTISYTPGNIRSHDQGELPAFENLPVYNLFADYNYIHALPNKIEAEENFRVHGVTAASCSDEGNGKMLTNISDGDWAEYYVNVSHSGTYSLEYRVSSAADTGRIELIAKNISVSVLDLPITGSRDSWQNAAAEVQLTEGLQLIRINILQGGFNLNWINLSLVTGVKDNEETIIKEFRLLQNYPNPFNPATAIIFNIPLRSFVRLKIFDLLGKEIETIVSEELEAGEYKLQWSAEGLASGIYFYQLQAVPFVETKKLILLK